MMKAVLMLKNSDYKRYGALSNRLREGVTLVRNECPTTVADMYELMVQQNQNNHNNNRNGVSLLQQNTRSTNNNTTNTINESPPINDNEVLTPIVNHHRGTDMLQFVCVFTQTQDRVINPNWILLDTCSTDIFFLQRIAC